MAGLERIRLSELFVKSGAIMYLFDLENLRIINTNPAAQRFYGYSREEFLTKRITDINPLPLAEIKANLGKALRNETSFYGFQHRLRDGRLRYLEIHATPLSWEDEREVMFAMAHDMTDRIKAEKALKESEQRFRTMADGLKLAQIMTEVERMTEIVKKLSRLTTYRAGDYAGVSKILSVDESVEGGRDSHEKSLANGIFGYNPFLGSDARIVTRFLPFNRLVVSLPFWGTQFIF